MSKKYIEIEIVVDYLQSKLCSKCQEFETWTSEECRDCLATSAIESIKMSPPADVKPVVRGEWIGYPECLGISDAYADDQICCSVCKGVFSVLDNDTERFNFCPNCGADMGEEAKHESS